MHMKINVKKIAELANLPLTDDEIKHFAPQLEETLKYIEQLEEVDTKNVLPTNNVTGLENIMDEDVARPSLSQANVLGNAKTTHNGFFKVKGILENE